MNLSQTRHPEVPLFGPSQSPPVDPSVAAVLHVVGKVEPSPDPKQVFQSLARAAVPVLCDSATVVLEVEREQRLRFSHPGVPMEPTAMAIIDGLERHHVTADSVTTPIDLAPTDGQRGYRGTFTMSYHGYQPSAAQALIGHLLVLQANAVIARERLLERAGHLERALASNREIGSAMGILMINHKVTSDQAFDLLRRISQHGHRKLNVVAREVVELGMVELPAGIPVIETASPSAATPAIMPRRSRHTSRTG